MNYDDVILLGLEQVVVMHVHCGTHGAESAVNLVRGQVCVRVVVLCFPEHSGFLFSRCVQTG